MDIVDDCPEPEMAAAGERVAYNRVQGRKLEVEEPETDIEKGRAQAGSMVRRQPEEREIELPGGGRSWVGPGERGSSLRIKRW